MKENVNKARKEALLQHFEGVQPQEKVSHLYSILYICLLDTPLCIYQAYSRARRLCLI